tara:strand:+ start:648 stop:1634 length:987 start_codon:yes stop_codon:yes gene_type:complete
MKLLYKQLLNLETSKTRKFLFFLITFFSSIIITTEPAYSSAEEDKCKDLTLPNVISDGSRLNGGNGCTISPSVFKVNAVELGICTEGNNPFSSSGLDTSGCFILWSDDNGYEANLVSADGTPATVTLDSTNINEPPIGSYKYAYIIIDDTVKLKASFELTGETWKTSNDSNHIEYRTTATDEGPYASIGKVSTSEADEVPTRLGLFDTGCSIENFTVANTTISGLILKSDKSTVATIDASSNNFGGDPNYYCSGSKYIAGIQTLNSPVVITENTTSGTLAFDTTNTGVWVESYTYGSVTSDRGPGDGSETSGRPYFDMGPFIVRFTVN